MLLFIALRLVYFGVALAANKAFEAHTENNPRPVAIKLSMVFGAGCVKGFMTVERKPLPY